MPTTTFFCWPKRMSSPWWKRRSAIAQVQRLMRRMPVRAGSRISSGAPIRWTAMTSKSGVNATKRWMPVSTAARRVMKRRSATNEFMSMHSAVEAASIMMMGASMSSASGNTTPPKAAR